MKHRILALLSAIALAGCDDLATPTDVPADLLPGCSGTLSGAVSETIVGCRVTWTETNGVANVGSDGHTDVSDESLIDNLGYAILVKGDPFTGPLTRDNVDGFNAGVDLKVPGGTTSYLAFYGTGTNPPPPIGSLSANITSFVEDTMSGSVRQWVIHGTVSATLMVPGGTAADTIELAIEF